MDTLSRSAFTKRPELCEQALQWLTPADIPQGLQLLLALDTEEPVRRRMKLSWMIRQRDAHAALALLVALDDPDAEVRIQAAEGLGVVGDERAALPLIAALQGAHPPTQEAQQQRTGNLGANGLLSSGKNCSHMRIGGCCVALRRP